MASQVSTGSPKSSRRQTPLVKQTHGTKGDNETPRNPHWASDKSSTTSVPVHSKKMSDGPQKIVDGVNPASSNNVNSILAQLRVNDTRHSGPTQIKHQDHLDKIIAGLKDQHKALQQQQVDLQDDSERGSYKDQDRSSGSELFTPATESFDVEIKGSHQHAGLNVAEMTRIKQELEAAKSVINRQEQELAESRTLRHTMEQAMGPASEADFPMSPEPTFVEPINIPNAFNVSARPFMSRGEPTWPLAEDGKIDLSSNLLNTGTGRGRNWQQGQAAFMGGNTNGSQGLTFAAPREARANSLGYVSHYAPQTSPIDMNFPQNRTFSSGSSNVSYGMDERLFNGAGLGTAYTGLRRPTNQMRTNTTLSDPLSPITSVSTYGQTLVDQSALAHTANGGGQFGYLDRAFGGQTSPIGPQFAHNTSQLFTNEFALANNGSNNPNYVMPAEPMNYRRLLDKTVSCDWKYIVDKIVCNNDQQASIFLQQKLKVGTAEQKYEIVEAIVNQAYPLMINRFGNFLVQRCFEHGTPEQVIAIANAIHGNVISLSMDPFGCHVIQKAFDSVPEDHKADMVRELLRRIPDTVIHRYACHVWQKLFELRWSGEPPQIMVKVNEALQGMWHEVALGETGSLVVQNIFENCVEDEKRPAIEEVIANIDLIAHGQFGNWCIQHLCEHGSPPDKRRVIDHILTNSYNYSIDQFASKVVEKCLKIGGSDFLERYLGVITTARPDRPRIPLIDIAGDQYGNYLVQWILVNTHQHQREQVAVHIRKHMVSLRGSKFGSRVAMLCSNPASITRPGTASAMVNPYPAPPQQRLQSRYR